MAEPRDRFGDQPRLSKRPPAPLTEPERPVREAGQRGLDLLDLSPRVLGSNNCRRLSKQPIPEPEKTNAEDALEGGHGRTTVSVAPAIAGPEHLKSDPSPAGLQHLPTPRPLAASPAEVSGKGGEF